MSDILKAILGDSNSDVNNYAEQVKQRREQNRRRAELKNQFGLIKEKEAERLKIEAQGRQTANNLVLAAPEKKSWLDNLLNWADAPSRAFTRPLMGTMLSGIYRALPGEQAGEAQLREAAKGIGYNPANIFFNKQTAEDLRGALKETKLPWGVYTAMEIGLDPIAFVPIGRVASPGIKALKVLRVLPEKELLSAPTVSKFAEVPTTRKLVKNNFSINEIDANLSMAGEGWLNKRVARPLSKLPGFRRAMGVINPSSLTDTDAGRLAIGKMMMYDSGKSLADISVSHVAKGVNGKFPFVIGNDGLMRMTNKQGKTIERAWADVFQNPNKAEWSKYLSKSDKQFIKTYQDIVEETFTYAKEHGIKVNELGLEKGERFIPRFVLGRGGFEEFANVSKKPMGTRSPFEKSRFYQHMQDGIDEGVTYYNDPVGVLRKYTEAVYKLDADKQFDEAFKALGKELTSPEIARAAGAAKHFVRKNNVLTKGIGRGKAKLSVRSLLDKGEDLTSEDALRVIDALKKVSAAGAGGITRGDLALQRIASQLTRVSTMRAGKQKKELLDKIKDAVDAEIPRVTTDLNKANETLTAAKKAAAGTLEKEEGLVRAAGMGDRWFSRAEVEAFNSVGRAAERNAATGAFFRTISTVGGAGRAITAGLDFGGSMIQGFPTLVTRPRTWARAQKNAFQALLNPRHHAAWKSQNADRLARMVRYTGSLSRSEYFEGAERGLGLGALPVLRTFLDHAGAGFNSFGDVARLHLFESMEPMVKAKASKIALKRGLAADSPEYAELLDKQLTQLGGHVSKMTGTISNARLGISATQAEIERGLLFAPRYIRSTVGLLADVAQGNIRGTLARDAMAGMLAGGLIYYYGLAVAFGQEPKLDPTKGDFMTVDYQGNKVGFGGAWISLSKSMSKIIDQANDVQGGEEELSKIMNIANPYDSTLGRYVRYKTTPLVGLGWDMATGRDALGRTMPSVYDDPIPFVGEGMKRFLPFSVQGFFDEGWPDDEEEWEETATGFVGDFFGLRTFPTQAFSLYKERRDELARANGAENWDTLNPLLKKKITDTDNELAELKIEIDKYNLENADEMGTLKREMFEEIESIREDGKGTFLQFELDWQERGVGGRDFRHAIRDEGLKKGVKYDAVYGENSRYLPALADIKAAADRGDTATLEEIAKEEYIMRMFTGAPERDANGREVTLDDEFGGFNYSEYERRENDMRQKYGEEVYINTKLYFDNSAELPPMARELRELTDLFGSYWKIGESIAEKQGLLDVWVEYKSVQGTSIGDELQIKYPILKAIQNQESATRIDMRTRIPLLDAFLLRYQYTTIPRNKMVIQKGKQWVQSYNADIQGEFPLDIE